MSHLFSVAASCSVLVIAGMKTALDADVGNTVDKGSKWG
jgi:hypothetical protein